MTGLPKKTNEGRKYRRLGVMRLTTKNLTFCVSFDIMYIESERSFTLLFATIAPKGLKVIHMV